ncbi:MAG: hypothetical protein GF308_14455 [Candidatus Heimdallarchaeota archaeon]|nr:hypothetical protein [Candidatus Heimdallarchaeota archaeon]
MEHKTLISKLAADKNHKKLGKIVDIVEERDRKTRKKQTYAVVFVHRFLRKDVAVLIEIEKLIKAEGSYAVFDILKDDFDQEVRETSFLV